MLTLQQIRDNEEALTEAYKKRQLDAAPLIAEVIRLDDERKSTQKSLDQLLFKSNELSKQIGELFKAGQHEEGNKLRQQTTEMKDDIAAFKDTLHNAENQLREALYQIPNIPHNSVPEGATDEDNVEISKHGE